MEGVMQNAVPRRERHFFQSIAAEAFSFRHQNLRVRLIAGLDAGNRLGHVGFDEGDWFGDVRLDDWDHIA